MHVKISGICIPNYRFAMTFTLWSLIGTLSLWPSISSTWVTASHADLTSSFVIALCDVISSWALVSKPLLWLILTCRFQLCLDRLQLSPTESIQGVPKLRIWVKLELTAYLKFSRAYIYDIVWVSVGLKTCLELSYRVSLGSLWCGLFMDYQAYFMRTPSHIE